MSILFTRYGAIAFALALIIYAIIALHTAFLRRKGLYPKRGEVSDEAILELVKRGDRVLAIKAHRELYGTSLREAKEKIEEIAASLKSQDDEKSES